MAVLRPTVPARGALKVTATSPGVASDSLELKALYCVVLLSEETWSCHGVVIGGMRSPLISVYNYSYLFISLKPTYSYPRTTKCDGSGDWVL